MGVSAEMVRLRLAALFCLLSLIARGRSERESLCKRCAVDRFNVKHKEQCRTLCPGVSSRPVWPPPGHLQGKEEKEEEDRVEVETSSWPAWPPSPDHCARCSRPRYRSANEDVCKDCPESESENPEKANKKVKRKDGKREKKKNKKESKKNKEQTKRKRIKPALGRPKILEISPDMPQNK